MLLSNLDQNSESINQSVELSLINGRIPIIDLYEEETVLLQDKLESMIARVVPRLSMERRKMYIGSSVIDDLLFRKLSMLATGLEADFVNRVEDIKWDDFADNSIKVTFLHRKDIILNIYVNDDEEEDSLEEAFLSYTDGNTDRIEYNSLPLMIDFLKNLL